MIISSVSVKPIILVMMMKAQIASILAFRALTCSRMPSMELCFHTKNMFFFASENLAIGLPKPPLCPYTNLLTCLRPRFMPTKTSCPKRASDDTEASKGDVLVFADMIKYKDLVSSDIEDFVENFLINEEDWSLGRTEKLHGFHIFVCAHGSRDMRCGVCGPALLERFEREISSQGLDSLVFLRSCSHVGGHKYAGHIIIYGKDSNGKIAGRWYGYVTPSDAAIILDEHISKGQIVHGLWRGKMGMDEEQ